MILKYRLKTDVQKVVSIEYFPGCPDNTDIVLDLRAGEVCRYFDHTDCYLFEARHGFVPWYGRETVEAHPETFEPIEGLSLFG